MRAAILGLLIAGLAGACAKADKSNEPPPQAVRELASGGARVRGGGVRMDVQVGRAVVHRPITTGRVRAMPAAVVTP
jgi:hypothetical protein